MLRSKQSRDNAMDHRQQKDSGLLVSLQSTKLSIKLFSLQHGLGRCVSHYSFLKNISWENLDFSLVNYDSYD